MVRYKNHFFLKFSLNLPLKLLLNALLRLHFKVDNIINYIGADNGIRTRNNSLEGCGVTITLYPHKNYRQRP